MAKKVVAPVPVPNPHSVKTYLNLDKAVAYGIQAAYQAMRGWLRGRPLDEVALMNRIVEKLVYSKCPPWRSPAYYLDRRLFLLHRQGKKQVDKYGADFAVTLNLFATRDFEQEGLKPSVFSKTALFQLKKGDNYNAKLNRAQLTQAGIFADRSFVLYAHETAGEYRIKASTELLAEFTSTQQKSKTFKNVRDWYTLTEWLVLWLTCQQGVFSEDDERQATEAELSGNVVPADKNNLYSFINGPFQPVDNSKEASVLGLQIAGNLGRAPAAWVRINLIVDVPQSPPQ
jgi:hypothetical protein